MILRYRKYLPHLDSLFRYFPAERISSSYGLGKVSITTIESALMKNYVDYTLKIRLKPDFVGIGRIGHGAVAVKK